MIHPLGLSVVRVSKLSKTNARSLYTNSNLSPLSHDTVSFHGTDLKMQDNTKTGWVRIPSAKHDRGHFSENVNKFVQLSHKNWNMHKSHAEFILSNGDVHIFFENGKPKLNIIFDKNEVSRIQGEKNNNIIPQLYLPVVQNYINANSFTLGNSAKTQIYNAKKTEKEIAEFYKNVDKDAIRYSIAERILPYFGIDVKKSKDGSLMVSKYKQPSDEYTYTDLGIDEAKMFRNIKVITGNAYFANSSLTNLERLEAIDGNAYFSDSEIESLNGLKYIDGNAKFSNSKVRDLGELNSIEGCADFTDSEITDLKNLEFIGDDANFESSKITDLGKLKYIDGWANFKNVRLKSLKNLENVKGELTLKFSDIETLGNLKHVGGDVDFIASKVASTEKLEDIDGNASFEFSNVVELPNLKRIGEKANFSKSLIKSLGALETIGGSVSFLNSKVEDLGNLTSIGKNANFTKSKIKDLKNLETIGGDAMFKLSEVENFGKLKSIGGNADFINSKIKESDIEGISIKKDVYFS